MGNLKNKLPIQWWVKYGHWCKTSWKYVLTGKHRGNQLKLAKL